MKNVEGLLKIKIDFLVNELGVNKSFIAKKIGVGRTTLSCLANNKNQDYRVASEDTIKKIIKDLNKKYPMVKHIGEE